MPRAKIKGTNSNRLEARVSGDRITFILTSTKWGVRDYQFPASQVKRLADWLLDEIPAKD